MAAINDTVSVVFDTREAVRLLAELSKLPLEVGQRLLDSLEAGAELFRVDANSAAAARTGELVVRLEPTDFLRGFMAAAGARNVNAGSVEHG